MILLISFTPIHTQKRQAARGRAYSPYIGLSVNIVGANMGANIN